MKQSIIRERIMIVTITVFEKEEIDNNLLMTYNADKNSNVSNSS